MQYENFELNSHFFISLQQFNLTTIFCGIISSSMLSLAFIFSLYCFSLLDDKKKSKEMNKRDNIDPFLSVPLTRILLWLNLHICQSLHGNHRVGWSLEHSRKIHLFINIFFFTLLSPHPKAFCCYWCFMELHSEKCLQKARER